MGFPDNSAQLGVQYNPGTTVNLWRGVYYNISTSHTSYVKNGINYNFRNWNNYAAETCSLRVLSNTSEFRSMYYPTTSLTIANNLEGGSSNNEYDLTWNDASLTQPWQYGQIFNAFDYADNSDDYTVEAVTPMPAINTTWWFQKWADGSTSNIKSNIQVTSPITYTAYYKGIQRSDDQDGYSSTSQRKFVKTFDGKLHYVYSSMGHLWYEISSDGGNSWQIANNGDYLDNGNGKLPSIYQFGYPTFWPCVIIVFQEKNGDNYNLKIKTFYNGILSDQDEFYIDENYSANSNPVVAVSGYCNYYRFIVVLQNTQGLYYKFGTVSIDGQLQWVNEQNGLIYGSDQNSNHPTITGNEIGITSGNFYLAWQENGDQIKYKNVHYSNDATGEPVITSESLPRPINPVEFSYNSGFRFNYLPSISLTGSTYSPIISWVGHNGIDITKVITKRGTTGNFQLLGDNVNNVNNNSTSESTENTVIIWSEGNPAVSKWTKRTGTIYHSIGNLYNTGIQTQVSNASSLSSIKAMVFNDQTAPYFFTLDNDNFSAEPEPPGHEKIKEIGTQLTYGRSGLVGKNQVNFVFNIGDIILADTNVQFIPRPDTIIYTNNNELNQVTRSLTFHLNSQSELYFTNYYYTVNADMADSALTEDDAVTFRAELVNANTDEVAGTFDNITYTKNNLDKYDNINYQVDCSGIEEGDYYLRLVTTVVGEANYNLANVQNDNPGLAKRNYKNINYTGKEAPIIYDLSQNYPNPFNPATTINYQVPENSFVTLKVYDILGKEVTTLVNEQKIQGRYSVNFDASRLASGVYIYQIRANDYVSAKKMLLLK